MTTADTETDDPSRPKMIGQAVLVLGATRSGGAMLEMFLEIEPMRVIGIFDPDAHAPGLEVARARGIPTFTDLDGALHHCKRQGDCIVYNLSEDEAIAEAVRNALGTSIPSGRREATVLWRVAANGKRIKDDLEASQRQFRAIFENAMDGIVIFDESGTIHSLNPAAENIFGYWQHEVAGRSISALLPGGSYVPSPSLQAKRQNEGESGERILNAREVVGARKGEGDFPCELSVSEMQVVGERMFIAIVRDITERKRAQQEIEQLAHYDFLTQLPNRALFRDRLEHAVANAKRSAGRLALLFIDLDGFKAINDRQGHEAGDEVLKEVAKRFTNLVRSGDTVARIGGDEFTVILEQVPDRSVVHTVGNKLLDALVAPITINGTQVRIGASIGASIFPDDADEYDGLLRVADELMFQAKRAGKNTLRFGQSKTSTLQNSHLLSSN